MSQYRHVSVADPKRMADIDVSMEGLTLHVRDVERSLSFYSKIPGSTLLTHRPGQFALFSIGNTLLGLLRSRSPGFHIEIATSDLDAVHDHLREAGAEPLGPPKERPWGERTFESVDPDGNRIEFQ